jgi:hypothetical protein
MDGTQEAKTTGRELDWQFCQVFGEPHFEEVTEVDIVSTVEFDSTGEYLAAGDRGGRVVIFQRVEVSGDPPRCLGIPVLRYEDLLIYLFLSHSVILLWCLPLCLSSRLVFNPVACNFYDYFCPTISPQQPIY